MSFGVFITCIALATAALIFAVVPLIIGKLKKKRATRPVEYYPPRGYSPIDVLQKYYGKRADAHDLFNPIMLYWAECGYITIEEDCKRGLKLTRIKNPEFSKKRDYGDAVELDNFKLERELFDELFGPNDVFYTLAAPSSYDGVYDTFMRGATNGAKSVSSPERNPVSKKLHIATCVAAEAVLILITALVAANTGSFIMAAMLFPIIGTVACKFAVPAISAENRMFKPFMILFFAVWSGAPCIAVLANVPADAAIVLAYAVATAFLTMTVLSPRIDIRAESDLEIYGRIDSFKRFLVEAELDKLETLVEDDPDYFYNILPYCYVLKITEKMKPKFDRIDMDGPSWYLGDLRDTLMF